MTRKMPLQKPGRSNQIVGTPLSFTNAVRLRLCIEEFAIDLAASPHNAVCDPYFDEKTNSLVQPWHKFCGNGKGWGWLNPPFEDIGQWSRKAWLESRLGAQVVMLVPAATDTQWWSDDVRAHGYATLLQQRIQFVGAKDGYPKGLALVLYAPYLAGGDCVWAWNSKAEQAKRLHHFGSTV